jgi:hypothetical protein
MGILILVLSGLVWSEAALLWVGAPVWEWAAPVVVSAVVAALVARARGRLAAPDASERRRIARIVGIASGLEGLGIFIVAAAGILLRAPGLIVPGIAVVVGLHMLPMALKIPRPAYYFTCAALVAIGLGGLLLPMPGRVLFIGLAAAAVMWGTVLAVVAKG